MTNTEMTCKELVELVTGYFEGALGSEERARFEQHLGECQHCTRYLDQMRETVRLVGRLSEATVSEEAKHDMLLLFRDWTRTDA